MHARAHARTYARHASSHLQAIELCHDFMFALFRRREQVNEAFVAAEPRPVLCRQAYCEQIKDKGKASR